VRHRDLARSQRGEDRLGQIGKAKAALHMADRHAETARNGFGIGAAIDDVAIGRASSAGVMASRIRFSARLISRAAASSFSQRHIDRVILRQHAAFDQQPIARQRRPPAWTS
jgi:hypothetical protein